MCFFLFHPCQKTDFYISTLPQMFPYSDLLIRKRKRKILAITRIVMMKSMRKFVHILIDTVLFSADLFHIIFHPFHRPSKWQMQYFWFPKKGAARSHSEKERSPIDTFLEKASATAFPRKVCFSTYQWAHWLCTHLWSKTIEVEFEIYRDCAFCRLCQTLGEIHVEGIATDRQKLQEPVHWEYKDSAFCSLLVLKAKQVRVF